MNWQELQNKRLEEYNQGIKGFTNFESRSTKIVKKTISYFISGKRCLDIGCGPLPYPIYMSTDVQWFGIDPLWADIKRDFEFKQGIAEDIPYDSNYFDGVLFSTSLDHVQSPQKAISETIRVLNPRGHIFIWGGISLPGRRYNRWKKAKKPAFFDKHHQLAFTLKDIDTLIPGYRKKTIIINCGLSVFKGYQIEMLLIYEIKTR